MSAAMLSDDTKFNPNDAYLLAAIAKETYQDPNSFDFFINNLGFSSCQFFHDEKTHTQAYVTVGSSDVVISFRGTEIEQSQDILTDLDMTRTSADFGQDQRKFTGKVYHGFLTAFHAIWPDVAEYAKEQAKNKKVWVTGHSLGAALATLAVADSSAKDFDVHAIYTIGSPRVGDDDFAKAYDAFYKDCTHRIVNNNDVVPTIPDAILFTHVGHEVRITFRGQLDFNPSCFSRFTDSLMGCCACFFPGQQRNNVPVIDGLTDHSSTGYVALLKDQAKIQMPDFKPSVLPTPAY